MKTLRIITLLCVLGFLVSCKDTKGDEMRKYYLNQSHDEALVGWWKLEKEEDSFWLLKQEGEEVLYTLYPDGKLGASGGTRFWYTKDGVYWSMHYTGSYWKNSYQSSRSYKVDGDKLYFKYSDNTNYTHFATKTTSPL